MTKARLVMIAGLTAIAAMMTVDASAQDCPEWLKWVCSSSASSNTVAREGTRQDKQLSRTKLPSRSAMDHKSNQARDAAADAAKPQQTQTPEPARAARLRPAMSDGEKEALFEQFLEWDKARRLNAETNR